MIPQSRGATLRATLAVILMRGLMVFTGLAGAPVGAAAGEPTCADRLGLARGVRADFDDEGVYVYQAFTDFTADNALRHQTFVRGSGFKFTRMTWLKLSLGWMVHRSGFASKPRQTRVLRIKVTHEFFRRVLDRAVDAHFTSGGFETRAAWKARRALHQTVFQWDPDRDLHARRLDRAVLQLGIGRLHDYAASILKIEDVTARVRDLPNLTATPADPERPYPLTAGTRRHLGIEAADVEHAP